MEFEDSMLIVSLQGCGVKVFRRDHCQERGVSVNVSGDNDTALLAPVQMLS
jgi:hypothetical protein